MSHHLKVEHQIWPVDHHGVKYSPAPKQNSAAVGINHQFLPLIQRREHRPGRQPLHIAHHQQLVRNDMVAKTRNILEKFNSLGLPIYSTYSSTHFGGSDRGMSKYCSGEHDEELEFLRRRSTTASLQNSTHLGVLRLLPATKSSGSEDVTGRSTTRRSGGGCAMEWRRRCGGGGAVGVKVEVGL
ncbi:hypothetical protein RHGRI_004505 [Rhododendron griersonianum]|uniref:Uncharacterized protein n=1 Tax=Rhododendron griersonianum TaxID=479676 RepID=A0AAV6LBU8_9ERIC|nr:hypothetical protein RHGRI_004505 [Rhododendron griersonianum]